MVVYILNLDFCGKKKPEKLSGTGGLRYIPGGGFMSRKPLGIEISKQAKHTTGNHPLKEKDGLKNEKH